MARTTAILVVASLLRATSAYDNGMAATPPMGWNSWCTGERAGTQSLCNALGADPCTETMVREVADAMVSEGMVDLGYNYLSLDDCWSAKTRNATGHLQPDPKQFPNGMAAVATYAWTDAGGSQHQLSLAFQSGPGGYLVHTEWYVPGFEATTLGVMIGPDFALSVIYAAGDSPPLPCPPKE